LYRELVQETLDRKKQYQISAHRVQNFEAVSQLEELELRKADAVARLNRYLGAVSQLEIKLAAAEASAAQLQKQLNTMERTQKLEMGIPPEVIYQASLSGSLNGNADGDEDGAGRLMLTYQTEVLNPSWLTIDAKYQDLLASIAQLRPELSHTQRALELAQNEIKEYQEAISRLRLSKQVL